MSAIEQTIAAEAPAPAKSRVGRWIEDPFASVIAGIVVPTFAVVFLLSAMAGISNILAV